MSLAIIEQPNEKNLFCGSLTFGLNGSALQNYVSQFYNSPFTGAFIGNASGIFRELGGTCTISCGATTGLLTASAPITFTIPLPTFAYSVTQYPINVIDELGDTIPGTLQIGNLGIITIYPGSGNTGSFTGAIGQPCGFQGFCVSYTSLT
jgi:hypothetical protein